MRLPTSRTTSVDRRLAMALRPAKCDFDRISLSAARLVCCFFARYEGEVMSIPAAVAAASRFSAAAEKDARSCLAVCFRCWIRYRLAPYRAAEPRTRDRRTSCVSAMPGSFSPLPSVPATRSRAVAVMCSRTVNF